MTSRLRPALVAASALLVLTACSGGEADDSAESEPSTSASTSEAAPADGTRIEAEGFSYAVPEGWEQNTERQGAAVTLAIDATDDDGFSDNVNVVADPVVATLSGEELEEAFVTSLPEEQFSEIEVHDPVTIDGEEAVHVSSIVSIEGGTSAAEQYAVSHDDQGYVITFSHNADLPREDRLAVAQSILASWTWA